MAEAEFLKECGATVKKSADGRLEAYFYHIDLNEEQIKYLSNMDEVELVALYCSSFGDEDLEILKSMKNLKKLVLNSCAKITDGVVQSIADIPNLELVSLVDTSVTKIGKERLRQLAPGLMVA